MINLSCLFCGCIFYTNNNRRKFCSHACYSKSMVGRIAKNPPPKKKLLIRKCFICGKEFIKLRKKFCSDECHKINHQNLYFIKTSCRFCNKEFLRRKSYPKIFCSNHCCLKAKIKEGNPNWRGGIKKERDKRKSYENTNWRKLVFERDNYKCVKCGSMGALNAHHIKPYSKFPELRADINNGITVCLPCHRLIHRSKRKNPFGLSL